MYDWFEQEGYADEIIEPVDVRWLCEYYKLFLHPEQLYKFKVDPNCNQCKKLDVYTEGDTWNEI